MMIYVTKRSYWTKEIAKSNRTKCFHCSFEGKLIPKGSIRFVRGNDGRIPITYKDYLCERCGKFELESIIASLKPMIEGPCVNKQGEFECPF